MEEALRRFLDDHIAARTSSPTSTFTTVEGGMVPGMTIQRATGACRMTAVGWEGGEAR